MTTLLSGRSRDSVVKGLAMLRSRLRHDRRVKCVDASPGDQAVPGGYSPMTQRIVGDVAAVVHRPSTPGVAGIDRRWATGRQVLAGLPERGWPLFVVVEFNRKPNPHISSLSAPVGSLETLARFRGRISRNRTCP